MIAANLAASSGTTIALYFATGDKGISGGMKSGDLPSLNIPFISNLPILGPLLSGHHILTYASLLADPLVSVIMARTPFGLRMRAVGVNPKAAAMTGITIQRIQMWALVISGALGSVAGAYLSIGYVT